MRRLSIQHHGSTVRPGIAPMPMTSAALASLLSRDREMAKVIRANIKAE
jgi:hypothetical protein